MAQEALPAVLAELVGATQDIFLQVGASTSSRIALNGMLLYVSSLEKYASGTAQLGSSRARWQGGAGNGPGVWGGIRMSMRAAASSFAIPL